MTLRLDTVCMFLLLFLIHRQVQADDSSCNDLSRILLLACSL